MKFELIIPSKHEYKNLLIILPKLEYNKYNVTIIDNSQNVEFKKIETLKQKFKFKLLKQESSGKGNALREAVRKSESDIIIFFDADLSHNPEDIKKFIKIFKKYKYIDHIGGSRMKGGSDELYQDKAHLIRLLGSIVINIFINIKFGVFLTDSQNGFRAIKRKVFLKCLTKSKHTTIEMELVAKTLARGFCYTEIQTHEWKRMWGVSKINLIKHSWIYLFVLLKIMFFYRKKKVKQFFLNEHWFRN